MKDTRLYTLNDFDVEMSDDIQSADDIRPIDAGKTAITLVSSDEYAPFAAVTIASILKNSDPAQKYDIVLLTDDMLLRNRWRILKLADNMPNVSLRIADISKIIAGKNFYTWAHFTKNTYYRLLVPDIFQHYQKVLYLDSDVVVNHDVSELFRFDLQDHYLAAAYDTHVVSYCTRTPALEQREYNIKELGMENPEEYFQAGVSIFNVSALRRDFGEGYLIKEGMEHRLRWLDQDLLNMLLYGRILRLPNCWNVMISNQPQNLDEYYLPRDLRKEYFEARRAPYIIHYVGRAMPCYTTQPDLFEYFWEYARLTPFYEILIQRMAIDYAEKLAESIRIQMRQELRRETFSERWKRRIRSFADRILPPGTKRRFYVRKLLVTFKRKP